MAHSSALLSLPQELIDQIFDEIDGYCTSVCLGLTCKQMYANHRATYTPGICRCVRNCNSHILGDHWEGGIFAHARYSIGPAGGKGIFLYQLIREFMEKGGYEYIFRYKGKIVMKFVKKGEAQNEGKYRPESKRLAKGTGAGVGTLCNFSISSRLSRTIK